MKICIRKEPNGSIYLDKTALQRFDEKVLKEPPYNYSFVEVDKEDFEQSDFNDDLTFSIEKYNARKLKKNALAELEQLKKWFDDTYQYKEQKYRRLRTLNKLCDDGSNPEEKLIELYHTAEMYRLEIQRLEEVNDDKGIDY